MNTLGSLHAALKTHIYSWLLDLALTGWLHLRARPWGDLGVGPWLGTTRLLLFLSCFVHRVGLDVDWDFFSVLILDLLPIMVLVCSCTCGCISFGRAFSSSFGVAGS